MMIGLNWLSMHAADTIVQVQWRHRWLSHVHLASSLRRTGVVDTRGAGADDIVDFTFSIPRCRLLQSQRLKQRTAIELNPMSRVMSARISWREPRSRSRSA
jgi:hypothetical protein